MVTIHGNFWLYYFFSYNSWLYDFFLSVLGYMSEKTGVEVSQLAVGGPGLSFIVYPEALSLMPFPWIWCILFFLMMITIG